MPKVKSELKCLKLEKRPPSKLAKMNDRQRADALLLAIAEIASAKAQLEAEALREIEAVKARYAGQIGKFNSFLDNAEKDLIGLMKANKSGWFGATDQVNLMHGILLHGSESKVTIPRDAVGILEELGWTEAVKIAKSVDREVVEKWPMERLVRIGADRKIKETFTYELKGTNPPSQGLRRTKGKEEEDGNRKRR